MTEYMDRTKNYGIYNAGGVRYWGQGTKIYRMGTGEFVKDLAAPSAEKPKEPEVTPEPQPDVAPEVTPEPKPEPTGFLTCNQCNRRFGYSNEVTKKSAATRVKTHLSKEHGIRI